MLDDTPMMPTGDQARLSLLAAIIHDSDDAIATKTLDGVVTSWNRGAERIFGYTAAEIVCRPITILFPPDRLGEETEFLLRLSRGEHVDHYETVRRRKDGRLIDISVTLSPLRDEAGNIFGVSKIARDITPRKRAEAVRRRAEADVRRQREELAHVLRLTTMGELTTSLAHEISQPLGAILVNAQAARRSLDRGASGVKEVGEALTDITADAQRASQVIQRLRGMVRKQVEEPVLVDVNGLIQGVVGLLHADMLGRHISVDLALDEAVPTILGDRIQLEQVVVNLVINACEAIAAADDGPRAIAIQTSQTGPGRLGIAISDSGVGVKKSELARIFDHFVSSKPEGLGMGLAISRSIVHAHGGRIWATRNDDRGLTLHVDLPTRASKPLAD